MQQRAGQKVFKCFTLRGLRPGRVAGKRPEAVFISGQGEALQCDALAAALTNQQPVAQVGHQNELVAVPVFADLLRRGRVVDRLGRAFDLNHSARRGTEVFNFGGGAVKLVGGEQAAVGVACAQVLELHHTVNLGLERTAHAIEQVVERGVVGGFLGAAAGAVNTLCGA